MVADIRLVLQVHFHDVPIKRLLLSKVLHAWRIAVALVLLLLFVPFFVSPISLTRDEGLATVWPVANPVSLILVDTFEMVFQMTVALVRLVTSFMVTDKWALVGVGAMMLRQPGRPSI